MFLPNNWPRRGVVRALLMVIFGAWGCAAQLPGVIAAAHWQKYRTAHVTILSAAPEEATRVWAIEFEQIYLMMAGYFPGIKGQPPLTVILFENKAQFADYTPLHQGQARDVAGYFRRVGDRAYVALNVADTKDGTRQVVYHEAVHWFFSAAQDARPPWLEEGLADLFSTMRVKRDEYYFGENIDNYIRLLQAGSSLNLKQVFAVDHQSPEYNENSRATRFYATAWAFLHYVVCGQKNVGFSSLGRYLIATDEGRTQVEAFREVFGMDFAQMDQELHRYVDRGKYSIYKRKFERAAVDRSLQPAVLSADELELELACLQAIAQRFAQAKPRLEELTFRLPQNLRVWETRGLLAVQEKDPESARLYFGRAMDLGSKSYFCHLGPAMAELAYREERGARAGQLAPAVARRVLDGIDQTILVEPERDEFYQMMPLLLLNAEPLTELDGRLIRQGAKLFPANLDLELGCAIYANRQGRKSEALARLEHLVETKREISDATRLNAKNMALNIRNEWAFNKHKEALAAEDYDEAISVVDERIALAPAGSRDLAQLRKHRTELENLRDYKRSVELLKSGKTSEAKEILSRLAEEAVVPKLKLQAQALLDSVPGQ